MDGSSWYDMSRDYDTIEVSPAMWALVQCTQYVNGMAATMGGSQEEALRYVLKKLSEVEGYLEDMEEELRYRRDDGKEPTHDEA